MEQIEGSIYDWPNYYEFVYGSDWQAETEFLEACFDRFIDGEVTRLFEPACGTGRLIYRLAKLGYEVSGLDLNDKAVAFCNQRFRKHNLPESAFVGDMRDFQLAEPFQAAFNTINSFRHLATDEDAIAHLKSMANACAEGGIYVLGFHMLPTDEEPEEEEHWSNRRGHLQINTSMWLEERNEARRMETHAIVFDVYTPTKQFRIKDSLEFRTYTVAQFHSILERVPQWNLRGVYDFAYDLDKQTPLDGTTQDAIFILQKAS